MGTWITVIWNHKNGQTFFPMFEKRAGAWFAWIFMLTNPEEAGKDISYFSVIWCDWTDWCSGVFKVISGGLILFGR